MMTPSMQGRRAVLVLVGRPGRQELTPQLAARARHLLGSIDPVRWLAEGEACELDFVYDSAAGIEAVRKDLADQTIDIAVVEPENRRKRLLVADMESTIIEQEMLDEIADALGIGPRIAAITERAMRGEIDFEDALRERVAMLAGADETILDTVYDRVILMAGAETLIKTMRAHGAFCALVTGGFTQFSERIAARLGFDFQQANMLITEGGRLTGGVNEPILERAAKRAALLAIAERLGLETRETMAVGDGANDLDMIRAAGLGVAFRAKPLVAAEAAVSIRNSDLTALLYLQGYARDDFVGF